MIDYCDEFISLFLFNMCHSGNNMKRSYNVLNGESNINLYYFYTLNDMPLTKQIFRITDTTCSDLNGKYE